MPCPPSGPRGTDPEATGRFPRSSRGPEERYRLVLAGVGDPIALLDAQGRYVDVNGEYEALAGRNRESILGEAFEAWAADARDRKTLRRRLEEMASGETVRLEITRRRADGAEREVDLSLRAVSFSGESRILAIERDVTRSRRRRLRAEVAARIGRLLVESLDARAVLPAIAEQIRRLEPFERLTVLWPSGERDEGFRVFASWDVEGVGSPSAGTLIPAERELAEALRHGRPLRRAVAAAPSVGPGGEEERPELVYPLVHRGRVVSLVTLRGAPGEEFSPEAEAALAVAAPPLAAAVENTRLFRQVRESEEKFRTLVENSRDVIFRLGTDRTFRYVNPVVEQVLGYPPEAFYQDPGLRFRIMHPADRERHRSVFDRMLAGTDFPQVELRLRHRQGNRWVWLLLSVYPLRDGSGDLTGIEGILRDVTERKEAEAATREYERRLLALNEFSGRLSRERTESGVAGEAVRGLIGLFGAQGGSLSLSRDDQGLEVVRREGLAGLPRHDRFEPTSARGIPVAALSPPVRAFFSGDVVEMGDLADIPRDSAWAADLVSAGFLAVVAEPLLGESGTLGALTLYFTRPTSLEEKGRTVLRLASTQVAAALDRSRHLGQARDRAQYAERLERDLSEMAELMSRDLRAPAGSLRGLTEMLSRRFRRDGGGDATTLVERIESNSRELEECLDGVLRLLRSRTRDLSPETVDTGEVVRRVVAGHAPAVEERGGSIHVASTWPRVVADAEALGEILEELVANAVRAAGSQEAPRVRLGWSAGPRPSHVELRVEDNGHGLSAADRRRAFEPGRRVGSGTALPGKGLGLAVSRRLAESLQGGLELREAEEGGCLAVLSLPRSGRSSSTGTVEAEEA